MRGMRESTVHSTTDSFQGKRRKRRKQRRDTGSKSECTIVVSFLTHYRLHQAGKTDEAKGDMARLNKIRQEREAASSSRKAAEEGSCNNS